MCRSLVRPASRQHWRHHPGTMFSHPRTRSVSRRPCFWKTHQARRQALTRIAAVTRVQTATSSPTCIPSCRDSFHTRTNPSEPHLTDHRFGRSALSRQTLPCRLNQQRHHKNCGARTFTMHKYIHLWFARPPRKLSVLQTSQPFPNMTFIVQALSRHKRPIITQFLMHVMTSSNH